ncbi:hypothetical protein A3E39_04460 [Candidatus Uhrbacteria bacterium RIFCSPHIGHO2_12_FULL_60_25]|uniref:Uncharacterized protein n=1 Tax=Candidatus Uhrbacteria bacterium RIFCSPHIGHO2_12_FULL_60_25 TaxID=1802399 RepID=A0A1F7UIR5_9BACT|nr:MAG: hypothetical protein A3D73_01010 [Candidatus Uhrbacteria bacterium RIFCSPHIGHO2_02_FULL_60_44]OGL78139.1 MAG: hypothetical protein A3E39_04460 [Candidatus Uhrbacteria bacterium RIFCSPHIGHO2_12_FULL_60_25]
MTKYKAPRKTESEYDEKAEVYTLGHFTTPSSTRFVAFACGHRDYPAAYIKIPDRLKSLCHERGWLRNVNSHEDVVALNHPSSEKHGVRIIGPVSRECSDCIVAQLKRDLIEIGIEARQNEIPNLRVVRKRKR